jgi:serine protease
MNRNAQPVLSVLLIFMITVLSVVGCGGGGGGGRTDPTPTPTPSLNPTATPTSLPGSGNVSGNVSFESSALSLKSFNSRSGLKVSTIPLRRGGTLNPSVSNQRIIRFQAGLSQAEIEQLVKNAGGKLKKRLYSSGNTYVVEIDASKSSSLTNRREVLRSEDNGRLRAFTVPNDPGYTVQSWHYGMLRLPQAWSTQKGNSNVVVAVIDSGISTSHPDLRANLVSGYDFVDNDSNPSDTVPYYDPGNNHDNDVTSSHGTHVAGTISAVTNNGLGVAGVAWNVRIMPIRVLGNDGYGYTSDIAEGIKYAADHNANVINLSLGGSSSNFSQEIKDQIDYAVSKGITVVAAAGNESTAVGFPANLNNVIAVAALGSDRKLAWYSNFGPEIDVCAPGGTGNSNSVDTDWIWSTGYDKRSGGYGNSYQGAVGTSMATPHISGLVALLYSAGITSPTVIRQRLQTYTADLGVKGFDSQYGYGLPQADAVLTGSSVSDLQAVRVYAANLSGEMLTPEYYAFPDQNGDYALSNLPAGQYQIYGFLDQNHNGQVDSGDLVGYQTAAVQSGITTTGVNINLATYSSQAVSLQEYIRTQAASGK